jgi:hypothetical protein
MDSSLNSSFGAPGSIPIEEVISSRIPSAGIPWWLPSGVSVALFLLIQHATQQNLCLLVLGQLCGNGRSGSSHPCKVCLLHAEGTSSPRARCGFLRGAVMGSIPVSLNLIAQATLTLLEILVNKSALFRSVVNPLL